MLNRNAKPRKAFKKAVDGQPVGFRSLLSVAPLNFANAGPFGSKKAGT